ncbi:transmembrane protein 177-like isoform X1 [Mizuhopecten yessoensis]|uniref:transmembrane protein 177-like isoform X1 n=1 Tax=Mizuhopecten yessoensis TaxID=6573 RepID=UPI000B45BAAC|nr:transmembrane protein 177-like isoform X1 [Mizuhopecten yessoensis]
MMKQTIVQVFSMATKILEWMKSNRLILTVLGNAGTLYGLTVIPSTFGLIMYKRYYQSRIKESAHAASTVCNPDSTLRKLISQVKKDFDMEMVHNNQVKDDGDWLMRLRDRVKFMVVPSIEPSHKGSLWGYFGTVISIPHYFMNYSPENVNTVRSLSRGRLISVLTKGRIERPPRVPVDLKSEDGIALIKSLILTDEEKKFVLMREMVSSQHNSDHVIAAFRIVTTGTSLGLMYCTREFLIQDVGENLSRLAKTDLHSNGLLTKVTRGSVYTLILGSGLATYYSLLFLYKNRKEKQSDRTVAAISKNYAEAGREYYKRVLSRNLACRKILGPADGAYLFSGRGDLKAWFFRQETPITVRLAIMEDYLSKYNQEEKKKSTNSGDKKNTK